MEHAVQVQHAEFAELACVRIEIETNARIAGGEIHSVDGVRIGRGRGVPEAQGVAARAQSDAAPGVGHNLQAGREIIGAPPGPELIRGESFHKHDGFAGQDHQIGVRDGEGAAEACAVVIKAPTGQGEGHWREGGDLPPIFRRETHSVDEGWIQSRAGTAHFGDANVRPAEDGQ